MSDFLRGRKVYNWLGEIMPGMDWNFPTGAAAPSCFGRCCRLSVLSLGWWRSEIRLIVLGRGRDCSLTKTQVSSGAALEKVALESCKDALNQIRKLTKGSKNRPSLKSDISKHYIKANLNIAS